MLGLWKDHSIRDQEPSVQNLVQLQNSCVVLGNSPSHYILKLAPPTFFFF